MKQSIFNTVDTVRVHRAVADLVDAHVVKVTLAIVEPKDLAKDLPTKIKEVATLMLEK